METNTITDDEAVPVPRIPINIARILATVPQGRVFTKIVGATSTRPGRALPHRRDPYSDFVCRADQHVRVLEGHGLIVLDGDVYRLTSLGERANVAYARQSPQITVTRVAG